MKEQATKPRIYTTTEIVATFAKWKAENIPCGPWVLVADLYKHGAGVVDWLAEYNKLDDINIDLTAKLQSQAQELASLRAKSETLKDEASHYLAEASQAKREIDSLKAKLEALTSENEKLKSEHVGLAKLYKRANDDVGNLRDERDKLSAEVERLKSDKAELSNAHDKLGDIYQELADQRNALQALANCYRTALEKVDQHWFDKALENYACLDCDMGDSGRRTNPDGHDYNCCVSGAHQALADAPETGPSKDEVIEQLVKAAQKALDLIAETPSIRVKDVQETGLANALEAAKGKA